MTVSEGTGHGRYRVIGRVQGVGFRRWTRRFAENLSLEGAVRNLPDGSVEVVAQGAQAGLAALQRALESGPPLARVDAVEVLGDPPSADRERGCPADDGLGGWMPFRRA